MLNEKSKGQLTRILNEFNNRSRPDSVLIAEAFPLLSEEISDEMRQWLAQEIEGYGVLRGPRPEGVPASAKTYRQVYVPALRIYEGTDKFTRMEWPAASPRLVFWGAKLQELEGLLEDPTTLGYEIPVPITEGMNLPNHIQVKGTVHRDQVERIFGRLRQEFSRFLADLLDL